jgi:hypothetical protein
MGLPDIQIDLAARQSAVEDLQRRLTAMAGRPATAAAQQLHDQPGDQPEKDEPEHAHAKPSERTHSATMQTHHGNSFFIEPLIRDLSLAPGYRYYWINHDEMG